MQPSNGMLSVPDMVMQVMKASPPECRHDMISQVVLAGGSTLIKGFSSRLNMELTRRMSGTIKVKQILATPLQRRSSSWTGASILASLGSFQQMWISKAEYEEHGAATVHLRCK